jgi:SAM-dependent methyltransferase
MAKATKGILKDTGERMIPEFHKGTLIYGEHMTRYLSTENIVRDKIVLDIASGSGYGSHFMAKYAKKVYGVDVSEDAITYAREQYGAPNIEYRVGNGEKIPLEDNSVDVVITFETIEHIKDYLQFISEVKRVLKPDGIIIVSTPNDLEFAEGNHFHLHEFEYEELYDILKKDFSYIDPYFQGTWKYVGLGGAELFDTEGRVNVTNLNLAPLKPDQYLYFFLVCSNREIKEKIPFIGAMSAHYSDRQQQAITQKFQGMAALSEKLRIEYDEVARKLQENKVHSEQLQSELGEIKRSRAYKLALKARVLKSKVVRK